MMESARKVYSIDTMEEIRGMKGMRRYPPKDVFMQTSECVKKKKKTRGGKRIREKMQRKQQREAEALALAQLTTLAELKESVIEIPSDVMKKPVVREKRHASNAGEQHTANSPQAKKNRASSSAADNCYTGKKDSLLTVHKTSDAKRSSLIVPTSLSQAAEAAAASVSHFGVAPDSKRARSANSSRKGSSIVEKKDPRSMSSPPRKLGKHYSHDMELKQENELNKVLVSTLNKLTEAKFEKLSKVFMDEMLKAIPQLMKIRDPEDAELKNQEVRKMCTQRVLRMAVGHIFEKALRESCFCSLYANLCKFLHENEQMTSATVNMDGFRKIVIGQCQQEFENALNHAKKLHESPETSTVSDQDQMDFKKRMVGNIRFVAQLYLVNQVSSNVIMHVIGIILTRSVESKKSLGVYYEEELETLCVLITSSGKILDMGPSQQKMNHYFEVLQKLSTDQRLSSRIRFAILDLIDLRNHRWESRKKVIVPTSFDKQLALKVQLKASRHSSRKKKFLPKMSSTPKGTNKPSSGFSSGLEKAASLALMKVKGGSSKAAPVHIAPKTTSSESSGRFSFCASAVAEVKKKPFGLPAVTSPIHFVSESTGRKSLNIEPSLTSPRSEREMDDSKSTTSSTSVDSSGPEAILKKHVIRIVEELFSSHELKEALECVDDIPADSFDQNFVIRNTEIVGTMLMSALEKGENERKLTSEFLVRFSARKEVEPDEIEKGIEGVILSIEDLMIDCPLAPQYLSAILEELRTENVITQEALQVFKAGLDEL